MLGFIKGIKGNILIVRVLRNKLLLLISDIEDIFVIMVVEVVLVFLLLCFCFFFCLC